MLSIRYAHEKVIYAKPLQSEIRAIFKAASGLINPIYAPPPPQVQGICGVHTPHIPMGITVHTSYTFVRCNRL